MQQSNGTASIAAFKVTHHKTCICCAGAGIDEVVDAERAHLGPEDPVHVEQQSRRRRDTCRQRDQQDQTGHDH